MTRVHHPKYIPDELEQRGALGRAAAESSLAVQRMVYEQIKGTGQTIGCRRYFTPEDVKERLALGATGIRILTSLIFDGLGVVKKIQEGDYEIRK